MKRVLSRAHWILLVGMLLAWTGTSHADLVFTGSSGTLAASADFSLSGSTLTVMLTNTSTADVLVPTDVLTAVLFNSSGLTPVSASLNGSSVYYGSIVNSVGEGWQYLSGISAHSMNSGISAVGFGVFGPDGNFYSPAVSLDGLDYGILSAGFNVTTTNANTGVTGHGPLVQNSVLFTLTAAPGFDLTQLGSTVVFQYGTALTDPSFNGTSSAPVPLPPALYLLGSGLIGLAGLRRRLRF